MISNSVPSLKVHLTRSASLEAPLTGSLLFKAVQNSGKLWSLMRCQTALRGAARTADSVTEVEVGMLDAMMGNVVDI